MLSSPILFLVAAGLAIYAIVDVARHWRALLDERFTNEEREQVTRFTIFVLLPLSVLAHEGGHALAVKLFGGEVVDFGFYLFYGFVGHIGAYTALERALIAAAGTYVNVALGLGAAAVAWYLPSRRPAINYALFVFAGLGLLNALVLYPLIDAFGGVAGDWETIYSRRTPLFSALMAVNHIALLVAAWAIWRSPRFKRGFAERSGIPLARRAVPQPQGGQEGEPQSAEQQELAGLLAVAAALASNDWRHEVNLMSDTQAGGSQIIMRWESGGFQRALLVHATLASDPEQHVELHAAIESSVEQLPAYHRELARIDGRPTAQELVPYVRRFLDFVDTWNGSTTISPN